MAAMFDSIKEAKTALTPVMQDASSEIAQDVDTLLQLLEVAAVANSQAEA